MITNQLSVSTQHLFELTGGYKDTNTVVASIGNLSLDLETRTSKNPFFSLNFPGTHIQTHLTKEILLIVAKWFKLHAKEILFLSEVSLLIYKKKPTSNTSLFKFFIFMR